MPTVQDHCEITRENIYNMLINMFDTQLVLNKRWSVLQL